MKGNHQRRNHINTLVTRKVFKKNKKIDNNITKEEDGIINNMHGIGHYKTIIQKDIIKDRQLQQIGEATTTTHGIKGNKLFGGYHVMAPRGAYMELNVYVMG
jgi:hypothetical protein